MQAAEAASSEARMTWLTLATGHQLPSLAARLAALHGAEAAKDAGAPEAKRSDGGGFGPVEALQANLDGSMHTELTRWGPYNRLCCAVGSPPA